MSQPDNGLQLALMGLQNANSLRAMFSRGKSVYPGGTYAAQSGPGGLNMGRPTNDSIRRRMNLLGSSSTPNPSLQVPWR